MLYGHISRLYEKYLVKHYRGYNEMEQNIIIFVVIKWVHLCYHTLSMLGGQIIKETIH